MLNDDSEHSQDSISVIKKFVDLDSHSEIGSVLGNVADNRFHPTCFANVPSDHSPKWISLSGT
jgi:hypothetical protein